MTDEIIETARRLSTASRRNYKNPYEGIDWPDPAELTRHQWFTSPELISLYGHPVWDEMGEEQRKLLSFWEAVNFYSLNIHGEKALMGGLAQRLYSPTLAPVSDYLHHFLDEENKHSVWFGTFCSSYGEKVYPDRNVEFPRQYAQGEEDFLFFARVVIFEEIVDRFNAVMGKDDRLVPVAQEINARHHAEESRHLMFGRKMVGELWNGAMPDWSSETVAGVRQYLGGYLESTWRAYYNPDVYADAGLQGHRELARDVWGSQTATAFRRQMSERCIQVFLDAGILEASPL